MSRMPNVYPENGPVRWQDDLTGELPRAVQAYLNHATHHHPVSAEQLELVRDYCQYYINAPCWQTGVPGDVAHALFVTLRSRIKTARSYKALSKWMHDALEVGIDPL